MALPELGWNPTAAALSPLPAPANWQRWAGHWLGMAIVFSVLVHIALAWWMKDLRLSAPPPAEERWVEIELQAIPQPEPPSVAPSPSEPVETQPEIAPEPEPRAAETPIAPTPPTAAVAEPPPQSSATVITATPESGSPETWTWRDQLIRQGTHLAPPTQQDNSTDSLPENWTRAPIEQQGSWFDQYAPPGSVKQEVWEDTDGTIRLQTTLANGQRLCGRVLAADPLQPFSVGIPTWTTCGQERKGNSVRSDNPLRRATPGRRPAPGLPSEPPTEASDSEG